MDRPTIKLSVREITEFLFKSGDITPMSFTAYEMMQEGTKIHGRLQSEAGDDYKAEVRLSYERELKDTLFVLDGIADGIIITDSGVIIDEIKSTRANLDAIDEDYSLLHWIQAKCYAWMYCHREDIESITVRLTYVNVDTEEIKQLHEDYNYDDLEHFIEDLIGQYQRWTNLSISLKSKRDKSIQELVFPFDHYRKGQRELAANVYRGVRDKQALFAQAPTGTGKTMSVLFSSIKAMGEGMGSKIFYLTAKTITRQVAEQAIQTMQGKGLSQRSITLTAKDKICLSDTTECDPELCRYAQGHYDRINDAVFDILTNESMITRGVLIDYAKRHMVCPFEFGLDISLWVDIVICDYNYVFDPRAYLRRFFEHGGDYILLIDEAHNLVDRARDMYSATLNKKAFMKHRAFLKENIPQGYKDFNIINKLFIELRKGFEQSTGTKTMELPAKLVSLVDNFCRTISDYLTKRKGRGVDPELIDLYFECLAFLAVDKLYDERYATYVTRRRDDVDIKLFCIDPSYLINKACSKSRASVFFSATLQPMDYYRDTLGGEKGDPIVCLPSPFPREHLCVMVTDNVSTKYRDRDKSYEKIVLYIKNTVNLMQGNYFVFFPSFAYMESVYETYITMWPEDFTIKQERYMNDTEREAFLSSFKTEPDRTLTAFAVMGGIFSEGIDLKGDRLSGAIVIGVGLPQLSPERDIIARYYNENRGMGFEYAYMYPGMNRVLQAAGRVIRSEDDRGFIMLIDDRFLHRRYIGLFPPEWSGFKRLSSPETAKETLVQFYKWAW